MNNYQYEIIESNMHSPSNIFISKRSSNYTFNSIKKKQFIYNKKITSAKDMERISEDISIIQKKFFRNFHDYSRIFNFKNKYKYYLNESYTDIVLLIKEFPEFNIFEYINIMSFNNMSNIEKKKLIHARNNILLSILLVAKENQILENNKLKDNNLNDVKGINKDCLNKTAKFEENSISLIYPISAFSNQKNEGVFQNLNFLNPLVDTIKMLVIDENKIDSISSFRSISSINKMKFKNNSKKDDIDKCEINYEIELFFLSLLDYKDKARVIKQKYNYYFMNLIDELNLPLKFDLDKFINEFSINKDISELNLSELLFVRKILSNTAKRRLFHGIKFFTHSPILNIYLSEGRIWKNISFYNNKKNVYELWINYEKYINEEKYLKVPSTIMIEYGKKLNDINNDLFLLNQSKEKDIYKINYTSFIKREIKRRCKLPLVLKFKDLITIFLLYDLKELTLYCIKEYYLKMKKKIPLEIFNLCLDHDQDISIEILDKSLNNSNVTESYMVAALMRKYFRFARFLLKFKKCRNFLNTPPPESENYMYIMYKQQNKIKNEQIMKYIYTKGKKNDGDELINFLKEEIKQQNVGNPSNVPSVKTSYILNIIAPEPSPQFLKKIEYSQDYNNLNIDDSNNMLINSNNLSNILNNFDNEGLLNNKSNFKTVIEQNGNLKISISPKTINEKEKKIVIKKINNNIHNTENLNDKSILLNINKSEIVNPISKAVTLSSKINKSNLRKFINKLTTPKKDKKYNHKSPQLQKGLSLSIKHKKKKISKYIKQFNSHRETNLDSDEIKFTNLSEGNLPKINVQFILIEHLRYGEYLFDSISLLSSIKISNINLEYVEKTCKNLLVFTTTNDSILKCPYPLLSIALSAEYLKKIGNISQKIYNKTCTVAEELLKLGECMQSSMKDEDLLNYFLREQKDYIGRNALEIYAENDFNLLLSDIGVGDIVGKMWYGNGQEERIFRFFRLTRILKANMAFEHYSNIIDTNYLSKNSVFSFQFYSFINNCSNRFTINSVSIVISTLLYQTIIYFYVNDLDESDKSYIKLLIFSHTMAYSNLINSGLYVYYHYKTRRRFRLNKIDFITNLIFATSIFLNIINLGKLIYKNYEDEEKENYNLINGIIYSIIITTSWIRFVNTVLLTNIFGSFFRIIFQIIWHVFAFLLIVFCITFLFAQCFTVFFQKTNPDYEYIYKSFIALFNSAFGQIEFESFTEIRIFGYIVLMGYTVISNIMLFNLIVCIINNLFESCQEKSIAENMSVLVVSHERMRWDEKYGLIILLPAPLNLISLIFIIFLVIYGRYNEDEKVIELNFLFSKICYFSLAFLNFLMLFLVGIIVYPFVLIKSFFYTFYYESNNTNLICKILQLLKRPFSLIYYFFEDLYIYWTLVYKEPVVNNEKLRKQNIAKEYILALRKILINFKFQKKKRIIPIQELYFKLRLIEKKKNNIMQESSPISSGSLSPQKNNSLTIFSITYNEQLNAKETMKTLISKIVDNEGYIDIDRTLLLLPYRVNYSEKFFKNLNYINIRIFQRGISKYLFQDSGLNQFYSFKKLLLLINKIYIKFKLMYHYVPKEIKELIQYKFNNINKEEKFSKSAQTFLLTEQIEEISEYDDNQDFHFITLQ